jgi:hypothetical protein
MADFIEELASRLRNRPLRRSRSASRASHSRLRRVLRATYEPATPNPHFERWLDEREGPFERARQGDEAAFERLGELFRREVGRMTAAEVPDEAAASELLAEALRRGRQLLPEAPDHWHFFGGLLRIWVEMLYGPA